MLMSFWDDYVLYMRSHSRKFTRERLECQMLLQSHALEKGMSLTDKRSSWGGVKALSLCENIEKYTASGGKVNEVFILSVNVLHKYRKDDRSCKDAQLMERVNALCSHYSQYVNENSAGVTLVGTPPSFNKNDIRSFFDSRHSIRQFSEEPITDSEISAIVNFAECTPTACNRQSSRVYVYRERSKIAEILQNQLGDQGWCSGATALFVVTGCESLFGGVHERKQVYIDGGLYAMNLVYGMHLQHIASCYKMFVREPRRERVFKKICGIPANETPIVLVLAGHYTGYPVLCPRSHRFCTPTHIDGKMT